MLLLKVPPLSDTVKWKHCKVYLWEEWEKGLSSSIFLPPGQCLKWERAERSFQRPVYFK